MRLSVYFTPVNCRFVGNVHWVQISKSNFPRVRIILNAEIEFFNNDCYAIIHYILLLLHRIELFRPGVNTIIICDFTREHESFATRSVPYNKDKSIIQKYIYQQLRDDWSIYNTHPAAVLGVMPVVLVLSDCFHGIQQLKLETGKIVLGSG